MNIRRVVAISDHDLSGEPVSGGWSGTRRGLVRKMNLLCVAGSELPMFKIDTERN